MSGYFPRFDFQLFPILTRFFFHRQIAGCFEEYYLKDKDDAKPQRITQENMSWEEKWRMWEVHTDMDDPNSGTSPVHISSDELFMDDVDQLDSEDNAESNVDDSQLSRYQKTMTESTAFQWLLARIYRETYLTVTEANAMHEIATKVRRSLYILSRRESYRE